MLSAFSATVLTTVQYQQRQQMPGWAIALYLVVAITFLIAEFKLFAMADEPAWAVIVPIYGAYVFFKIIYGNGWKFLLLYVPILGTIMGILMYFRLAQVYGRSTGFGIGLLFLSPIFILLLAFDGKSSYMGPSDSFI